jgi:polyisoprenoid-binding protein YceI
MRIRLVAAALAIGIGASIGAALAAAPMTALPPPPASTSIKAADAPGGGYTMDARHSSVIWRLRHQGLSIYQARFDTMSSTMTFDPAHPEKSRIEATIAVNSVDTGLAGDPGRTFDKTIAGDFLGGTDITFKSTSITLTGPQTGLVTGALTLHGVTKPVVLEVKFEGGKLSRGDKYRLAFSAHTVLDRTAFGVSSPIIDASVSKEIEVLISTEFVQS